MKGIKLQGIACIVNRGGGKPPLTRLAVRMS